MNAKRALITTLFALAATYAVWFRHDRQLVASLLVFAAPPLLLALATLAGLRRAPFCAAVLALGWFSHAVMVAWTRPGEAGFAAVAIVLSLLVVLAANAPALQARFGGKARAPR